MDNAACNIIYVDRGAGQDLLVQRDEIPQHWRDASRSAGERAAQSAIRNIATLLGTFSEVYVCTTGKACVTKLSELHDASLVELVPTVVLIDMPSDDALADMERYARTPSPTSMRHERASPKRDEPDGRIYGLALLQWIVSDIQPRNLSLVVPVALLSVSETAEQSRRAVTRSDSARGAVITTPQNQLRTRRYVDVGAVDVLTNPLLPDRLPSLAIHAYKAHRDSANSPAALREVKRDRKRSWVGLDEQKPYSYLREAMVSGLMDGICQLDGDQECISHPPPSILDERRAQIAGSIGVWSFSAHDFTDDELLYGAMLMLQHALSVPDLEKWRMPAENLMDFLVACRAAYNSFVPYHNFRHVIDVLQACFHFLTQLGTLPPYPANSASDHAAGKNPSPLAALMKPFDALTLLITAIGHDVGHPGVNNAFLVTLNAPLAQLYNDRSVLESFHCAAYSQILRRYWPAAFATVEMRQLMISSILATDMGLHFDYMKKMGFLQEKLFENKGTDGWNGRTKEEYRTLACSLLIKCADISNVARRYDVAAKWTMILTDEFARQASMEADLGMPSALFAPPVREIIELGRSQIGFMNMFAIPLFQGVSDLMPAMTYCVDELQKNRTIWQDEIASEQERLRKNREDTLSREGTLSPGGTVSPESPQASAQMVNGSSISTPRPLDYKSEVAPKHLGFSSVGKGPPNDEPTPSPKSAATEFPLAKPFESEHLTPPLYSLAKAASKPSSAPIQVPYATTSPPGLLIRPSKDAKPNGVAITQPSLVTEAVIPETAAPARRPDSHQSAGAHRCSDAGDGSNSTSNTTDWQSQATSATTSKLPLSPSTQGTSIMSNESCDKSSSAGGIPSNIAKSRPSTKGFPVQTSADDLTTDAKRSPDTIMETMRNLAKKPSRSRFRFWKKKGSGRGDAVQRVPSGNGTPSAVEGLDQVSVTS
ncbi:MAG: 3',5'-cyclic-nucleotide phosphodiesterase [Claussenomyces sp. TS43310]|nr:MAG: 3',5'-cyclic-nucleotide phosphodiesterase [Claussenomyces sp. TS43310]